MVWLFLFFFKLLAAEDVASAVKPAPPLPELVHYSEDVSTVWHCSGRKMRLQVQMESTHLERVRQSLRRLGRILKKNCEKEIGDFTAPRVKMGKDGIYLFNGFIEVNCQIHRSKYEWEGVGRCNPRYSMRPLEMKKAGG